MGVHLVVVSAALSLLAQVIDKLMSTFIKDDIQLYKLYVENDALRREILEVAFEATKDAA